MRGTILRANEFHERPLDSIVLVKIHSEALRQAEESSVIRSIEEGALQDIENMRLDINPALQALDHEQQLESKHFHVDSPGRQDATPQNPIPTNKIQKRYGRTKTCS